MVTALESPILSKLKSLFARSCHFSPSLATARAACLILGFSSWPILWHLRTMRFTGTRFR